MERRSRVPSDASPLWLVAAIASFVVGGLFAFFGRVLGVKQPAVLVAIALIGAGIQAFVLIAWYLHFTRPRPQVRHWFAPRAEEPAPYSRWPEVPLADDRESRAD